MALDEFARQPDVPPQQPPPQPQQPAAYGQDTPVPAKLIPREQWTDAVAEAHSRQARLDQEFARQQYVPPRPASPGAPAWLVTLLVATTIIFAALYFRSSGGFPDILPDGDTVEGPYGLIIYDPVAEDYTDDQWNFVNAVPVAKKLEEGCVNWDKIPIKEINHLDGMDPVYQRMIPEHIPKTPWLIIWHDNKKISQLVESYQQGMDLIDEGLE